MALLAQGRTHRPPPPAWAATFELLAAEPDVLARRLASRVRTQVPAIGQLGGDSSSETHIAALLPPLLRAVRDAQALGDEDVARWREVGAQRAREGLAVDDLVAAQRAVAEALWDEVRDAARSTGLRSDAVLGALHTLERAANRLYAAMLDGYRAAAAIATDADGAALLRAILAGGVDPDALRRRAADAGLDPDASYRVLRARRSETASPRTVLGLGAGDGPAAELDGDVVALAHGVPASASSSRAIGVGPAVSLEQAPASLRLATRALRAALALGLTGPQDLATLGPRAAVTADTDVAAAIRARHLAPLEDAGALAEPVLDALRAYLEHDRRHEPAAKALHVHPNTLRYRLRRYEELTGTSLRRTEDLVGAWWAVRLADMA